MQWELWDIEGGNLIGWRDAEADALALVRELVRAGWPAETLSLLADDELLPIEALAPAVSGDELVRRAQTAGERSARRMA